MADYLNSPSDIVRHEYRDLSSAEKDAIQRVKDTGAAFLKLLNDAVIYDVSTDRGRVNGREIAIARTKIEEAVMWAVKGITHPHKAGE